MSQWLSEVWDNLSCLNLCVHSHSLCQHLNLVVILKLAQRKPWSPVLVLPFHVPAPKLLGVTRREDEAQRGRHCCATQTPLLQQPCPGTAPQPLLYAQGCRKPPLCSCAPAGCWMDGCECSLGHYVRQDPAPKRLLQAPGGAISSAVCPQFRWRWL